MTNYFKVGEVSHYYDKIGVAVVNLSGSLAVGDTIKFNRGEEAILKQKVESIQMEHLKVDFAKSGDVVGLKTQQNVKKGAEVYKIG